MMLLLPSLIGFISVATIFSNLWDYRETIYQSILFEPGDSFLWVLLYNVARFFASVALFVLTLLSGLVISNIVSAPIYEIVSVAVEREKTGKVVEISIWESIKLIPEELKKVLAILFISIILMFLPIVNFVAVFLTAFFDWLGFLRLPASSTWLPFSRKTADCLW